MHPLAHTHVARRRTLIRRSSRHAFTVVELLVAATLLITLISIVIPLAMRATRIRQEGRAYQLAVDELNNQLETLTLLPDPLRQEALRNWKADESLLQVLPEAELTGETIDDKDGKRLRLSMKWKKAVDGPAVTVVGWIHPERN